MKIITLSRIGYNHPRNANWSYGVWKIDLIDTDRTYNMSHVVKETFGGDSRLRAKIKELTGYEMLETKGVVNTPEITGMTHLWNMEGEEIIKTITEFLA